MSDEPALRPGLAVGEALRAVARNILADARAASEDPARSDAVAVHDFRREMKRWRALLRLLDPFVGEDGRRLRDGARDLARALGGARDAQSALDALADLAEHGVTLSGRSLATVRGRIDAVRQAAEATIVTGDMRLRIARTLDEATAAVEVWPVDALSFAEIAERLARGYGAARRALPQRWPDAEAEALHELRKRIVNHRYQVEIATPLWRRFGRMWIGEAQRLRDRLGKHQDLLTLERLTGAHQPLAHWRGRLAPAIEARKAVHVAAASRIAARLLVEKPKAFRRRLEVMWETGS
jgi:CHAD domain-containing protein